MQVAQLKGPTQMGTTAKSQFSSESFRPLICCAEKIHKSEKFQKRFLANVVQSVLNLNQKKSISHGGRDKGAFFKKICHCQNLCEKKTKRGANCFAQGQGSRESGNMPWTNSGRIESFKKKNYKKQAIKIPHTMMHRCFLRVNPPVPETKRHFQDLTKIKCQKTWLSLVSKRFQLKLPKKTAESVMIHQTSCLYSA